MLHWLVEQIIFLIGDLWYIGIFLMMTIESSFIPFPSEVAMIPAWYLSNLGQMNFFIAFLAGTSGALTWASINYFLGLYLGRPIIKKIIHNYGKYIFLKESHYIQAEAYFEKHGAITTLLGRFIPAVRQLISIPAWVFRMNYLQFLIYTAIGASIWNLILMSLGYVAGENRELIASYTSEITLWVLAFILIIWVWYWKYQQKKNK